MRPSLFELMGDPDSAEVALDLSAELEDLLIVIRTAAQSAADAEPGPSAAFRHALVGALRIAEAVSARVGDGCSQLSRETSRGAYRALHSTSGVVQV
ncbi:hypothetical protein [Paracoccus sp. (in: a-proteobacteria)]|uniref:hypothetical protein n=1 Tax=Paracoccus sp. TaxID=267 RepID=UPI002B002DA1|nr:hypothetical protein [Paracoccus sp. (in: a-proteobacteria)]